MMNCKAILVSCLLALSLPAYGFERVLDAQVLRVVDGDTIEIEAQIWPQQWVRVPVRIKGIDAPEIFRPDCEDERYQGHLAKDRLQQLLGLSNSPLAPIVELSEIGLDKYGGRYVAAVRMPNGQRIGTRLMLEGLAKAWDGKGRTPDHCGPITEG